MNRTAEPYLKVMEAVNGYEAARILHVAVGLDVFSKLADEGKTAAQLATLLHVEPRALELLLNALTAMGFLHKEVERFQDTAVSHTYLSLGGPKPLVHLIRHQARRWAEWEKLAEAVRTGRPVRKPDMFQEEPEELEDFIRGMHELALARGDARYLARAIPLARCKKLLDLGGGPGTYASMFCRVNPSLEAVVMDLPATIKVARRVLAEFDTTSRVTFVPGDYRRDPIKGGPFDVALVSNILHAENEETNRPLLRKVFEALAPGGILILKDHVQSADHTEPEYGALFALAMLLTTRGRTYSYGEISAWLEAAGFHDIVQHVPEPPISVSLVLALRPGKRALAVLPRPAAKIATAREETERDLPALPGARPAPVAFADAGAHHLPDPRRAPRPPVANAPRPRAAADRRADSKRNSKPKKRTRA
jgi:SAM-dependent methyltransferase